VWSIETITIIADTITATHRHGAIEARRVKQPGLSS